MVVAMISYFVNCMLCAVLHFMRNKLYIIERGLRTTASWSLPGPICRMHKTDDMSLARAEGTSLRAAAVSGYSREQQGCSVEYQDASESTINTSVSRAGPYAAGR